MTAAQIEQWLVSQLAIRLRTDPQTVDRRKPIDEYGLDSMEIVSITGELEDLLGIRIEPTVIWDQRTIARIASYIATIAGEALPTSTAGMSDADVERMLEELEGKKR